MAKANKKQDFATEFANKIIEAIENGTAPWQKPWEAGVNALAENFTTGKGYKGMNCVWLSFCQAAAGYDSNKWGTFKQISDAGGKVRKGEKGTRAVFFSYDKREAVRDATGNLLKDSEGKTVYISHRRDRPVLSGFTVFNTDQASGLELPPPASPPRADWEKVPEIENVIDKTGVGYKHFAGNRAYYQVSADTITMPTRGQFESGRDYYLVALHELAHASGHPDRLNRKTLVEGARDRELYALEELRAEIASMMLGTRLGIGHKPQDSAAYVESWLKALRNDAREITRASIEAEKIATYLAG